MYIEKIRIQNYRNYNDFTMKFHKGLNVIIGANNAGKTGLLYAINLLSNPSAITVDDFNKNNISHYADLYMENAPSICIEYNISHRVREDDTDDESIIKLLPFLGIKGFTESRRETEGVVEYDISATIKAVYCVEPKYVDAYKKAVRDEVTDVNSFYTVLKRFVESHYSWHYTNGLTDTKADQKAATSVFDIRFIGAERTSDEVKKETRREITAFAKSPEAVAAFDKLKAMISDELGKLLSPSITKLADLFENEKNEIGLAKGNVSIASTVNASFSLADAYTTEVRDTRGGYNLPLRNNGLGYNNLVNIYMLIKLTEIHPGKDFRILCLEEPEAHLHPAMQYKLFKYLRELDDTGGLKQQIFVTTHSSNISAVAGLDNMLMLSFEADGDRLDCVQQSLSEIFVDTDGTTNASEAKKHLSKFLDVTRSDMLFADKVILVEGIAEKLLLPLFMEICGCAYEDEHISVVEIGGKHFAHFIEFFNRNAVKKKVLCITDKDFTWIDFDGDKKLQAYAQYESDTPTHISDLCKRFNMGNLHISTQTLGGRTLEDEFFLSNLDKLEVAKMMFKKAASDSVYKFVEDYGFNIQEWEKNLAKMDGRSSKVISRFIEAYKSRIDQAPENKGKYEKLVFAEIFLHYARSKKGDVALGILSEKELTNEDGTSKLVVPPYIQEGLKWLLS